MKRALRLTQEEKDILTSYEKGEWVSVEKNHSSGTKYRNYAKATIAKNKRINIRISEKDLILMQRKAVTEGIPYQTLISSLIHKYVSGSLVESR